MISKILSSKPIIIFISIILAFILFLNANATNSENRGNMNANGQSYSTTLQNIPIDIQYNKNRYFISGYTSTASVVLTGYNQIEILQQSSPDMRTFNLAVDLKNLGLGNHKVPILVKNLPKAINAKTLPENVAVTIERKAEKDFDVVPMVDQTLVPEGYKLVSKSVDPEKVNVIAGTNSIHEIDKIEAILPSNTDLTKTSEVTVNLVAVNKAGKIVPASLSQQTANLTVKIRKE